MAMDYQQGYADGFSQAIEQAEQRLKNVLAALKEESKKDEINAVAIVTMEVAINVVKQS